MNIIVMMMYMYSSVVLSWSHARLKETDGTQLLMLCPCMDVRNGM